MSYNLLNLYLFYATDTRVLMLLSMLLHQIRKDNYATYTIIISTRLSVKQRLIAQWGQSQKMFSCS